MYLVDNQNCSIYICSSKARDKLPSNAFSHVTIDSLLRRSYSSKNNFGIFWEHFKTNGQLKKLDAKQNIGYLKKINMVGSCYYPDIRPSSRNMRIDVGSPLYIPPDYGSPTKPCNSRYYEKGFRPNNSYGRSRVGLYIFTAVYYS